MTPRQYLRTYRYDQRLITGGFFSEEPLAVSRGDTVGVVLLSLGGPRSVDEVAPFLYNLLMDPVLFDVPLARPMRHWFCRLFASTRAAAVGRQYEVIGGGSPVNRLTREQAECLEDLLNARYGEPLGVAFKAYIANRYWYPSSEDAAAAMQADGVTKVVFLPLFPQYSKTTTGSSLRYWWTLQEAGNIPAWPTSLVYEYAAHPKYVQALSERIDQALQRFPRHLRDDVHLLFSAPGTSLKELQDRNDPYCCLLHATVDRVMAFRGNDRPFHVAFQHRIGPSEWLTPGTRETLKHLAQSGHTAVLVVPTAGVSDHIDTSYQLDIAMRESAEAVGILHYEVMPALNCHPLFIEALAEAALAQVDLNGTFHREAVAGDGNGAWSSMLPSGQHDRFDPSERTTRCHQCQYVTEPHRWSHNGEPPVVQARPTQSSA